LCRGLGWQRGFQPLYPKGERGRPPVAMERIRRSRFLRQWDALADRADNAGSMP
jgi:hypothetical protein